MNRYESVLISLFAAAALSGQAATPEPTAIIGAGRAEVRIPADRATLVVAIETRGPTAANAAAENARIGSAVLAALKSAGVESSQISSAGQSVRQNWRFDSNRQQRAEGFIAENAIRIETTKLDRIGAYIDTALAAGATRAGEITFTAVSTDQARSAALASAVATSRAEAAAMAKAAGGTLGRLLDINTQTQDPNTYYKNLRAAGVAQPEGTEPPTIAPREIIVSVYVTTRWQVDFP